MKCKDKPSLYFQNLECIRAYRLDYYSAGAFRKAYHPSINLQYIGYDIISRDAYLSEIIAELVGDGYV